MVTTHTMVHHNTILLTALRPLLALTSAGAPKGPTDAGWSATQVEKVGTAMRCFGLIAAADLKCGRLMIQATISHMLLLIYGNMRIRSKLISMGMAPQV